MDGIGQTENTYTTNEIGDKKHEMVNVQPPKTVMDVVHRFWGRGKRNRRCKKWISSLS